MKLVGGIRSIYDFKKIFLDVNSFIILFPRQDMGVKKLNISLHKLFYTHFTSFSRTYLSSLRTLYQQSGGYLQVQASGVGRARLRTT